MEQIYNILLFSFVSSKYFSYDNVLRIIILVATYPLLASNCYHLSLTLDANKNLINNKFKVGNSIKYSNIIKYIIQIILFSMVISYLQADEISFDIDDKKRYIIIIIIIILFFTSFSNLIINEI